MSDRALSPLQILVLRAMAESRDAWSAPKLAETLGGLGTVVRSSSLGIALKGLYKRGCVTRESSYGESARYKLTVFGEAWVKELNDGGSSTSEE